MANDGFNFRHEHGDKSMKHCSKLMLFALIAIAMTGFDCPLARADSCQPVFGAIQKLVTPPSHSYTTSTSAKGAASRTAETIMTQGKKYIRASGQWMDTHIATAEVLEQETENEKNGKSNCQFLQIRST